MKPLHWHLTKSHRKGKDGRRNHEALLRDWHRTGTINEIFAQLTLWERCLCLHRACPLCPLNPRQDKFSAAIPSIYSLILMMIMMLLQARQCCCRRRKRKPAKTSRHRVVSIVSIISMRGVTHTKSGLYSRPQRGRCLLVS